MNKILYSAVIYNSDNFDIFMKDYLVSVFNQTDQNFDLLLVLDDLIVEVIKEYIVRYNKNKKKILIRNFKDHTPIELRKKQIDLAYSFGYDVLVLSDFDENVAYNRVEEVSKYIDEYAFAFNDFYIVDQNLNRLAEKSFFTTRKIPKVVSYKDILKFNFIGLGSLAFNLKFFDYKKIKFPKDIIALDWYLVTRVLMSGYSGIALYNTYANYRQHNNSLVGFDFKLDKKKLMDYGMLCVEMEAAGLYALAAQHKKEALAILTISDHLLTGEETTAQEREQTFNDMMEIALETVRS